MFKVKWNTANTIAYLGSLKTNLSKARYSAINKMAAQTLTRSRKEIRNIYNIKLKDLVKDSRGRRITYVEKTYSDQSPAKVVGYGGGLSLGKFSPKQTPTGVSVEIIRGKRKIIKHTFGPKIARLGRGVFRRVGKKSLPIERLLGPGAALMLRNHKVVNAVKEFIKQKFKSIAEREIKYYLKIKK